MLCSVLDSHQQYPKAYRSLVQYVFVDPHSLEPFLSGMLHVNIVLLSGQSETGSMTINGWMASVEGRSPTTKQRVVDLY